MSNTNSRQFLSVSSFRLVVGVCVTLILSLSVHAIALEGFQVPVPSQDVKAWWLYRLVADVTFAFALVMFYRYVAAASPRTSRIRTSVLCLFIILGLNETLRGWLMDAYCSIPFSSTALFFAFMTAASSLYFVLAVGVVALGDVRNRRRSETVTIALITGAVLFLLVPPLVSGVQSLLFGAIQSLAPTGGWCKLPYGPDVLIPAYLTFIEPVLAAILLAAVTRTEITGTMPRRLLTFTLLVLALKSQLFAVPLYLVYSSGSGWLSIVSMGQFTLEAVVLAICAFLSWSWATAQPLNE